MGEVVWLDAYRRDGSVKSIARRLAEVGHDANVVRKTLAPRLREKGRSLSVVDLWHAALRRIEEHQTQAEAQRICVPPRRLVSASQRAAIARAVRLVVRTGRNAT